MILICMFLLLPSVRASFYLKRMFFHCYCVQFLSVWFLSKISLQNIDSAIPHTLCWTLSVSYQKGPVTQGLLSLSFDLSSFCQSGHFRGIESSVFFLYFRMLLETHVKMCMTVIFLEIFFCSKNWENEPRLNKNKFFFNVLKSLVINFYEICSIMKIHIMCDVSEQIPYLKKSCS